jgi:23S rRNA pseudouridine1911/1915/1917 synthase
LAAPPGKEIWRVGLRAAAMPPKPLGMSESLSETRIVPEAQGGERLDKALAGLFPEHSRSRLKALVLEGAVRLNGEAADDPARKIKAGDAVSLNAPAPVAATPLPEKIRLKVVYEDDALIVVDKPAGLVVHPSAGHETGTLVNALLHHCAGTLSGINGVLRPGIVHRLDKDTSGLLVAAKTDRAHKALAAQFADHGRTGALEREYVAVVWGVPLKPQGTIDAAIERSSANREKMAVAPVFRQITKGGEADDEEPRQRGRFAITHYRVEERFAGADGTPVAALARCALETGRTHQIRVHMAHVGHPLLGDEVYGAGFRTKAGLLTAPARNALEKLGRQALHAADLGFEHPETGEILRFQSDPPPDMARLIKALRG